MKKKLEFGSEHLTTEKVSAVVSTFMAIQESQGIVTPGAMLAAAVPLDSPIHECFEWDNTAAGKKYRLWQARQLIAFVSVRDASNPEIPAVRAFVSVNITPEDENEESPNRGYVSMDRVLGNVSWKQQTIDYGYQQLQLWKKKFGNLKEFLEVTEAISKVEKRKPKA